MLCPGICNIAPIQEVVGVMLLNAYLKCTWVAIDVSRVNKKRI